MSNLIVPTARSSWGVQNLATSEVGERPARRKKGDHARENRIAFDELVAQGGEYVQCEQGVDDPGEEMMGIHGNAVRGKFLLEG